MTTKVVYTGADDEISVTANIVTWDDVNKKDVVTPIPFVDNGTSKIEVSFADQVKDSVEHSDMISFDNTGNIVLKLNSLTTVVKNRSYPATVKVFDDTHPLGQTIIAPSREDSNLSLIFK